MNVLTADSTAQGKSIIIIKTKKADKTTTPKVANVPEQGAHVTSARAPAKKDATRKQAAPSGQKNVKAAGPTKGARAAKNTGKPGPAKETRAPRAETKGAKILALIGRAGGANVAEIMAATEWQAHSVRGFLSTAGKKQGITIESSKNEEGARVYRIAK
jgi:hypothetical protein